MPNLRLIAVILLMPACAAAQAAMQTPAVAAQATLTAAPEPDLEAMLWIARPLVVFADSPNDPRYVQQMSILGDGAAELADRRVTVLTDTDPAANGPLRRQLRPRDFGLVLIDTDGTVVQRRPAPTALRDLTGTIDRLPSRLQETGSRRR